MVSYKDSILVIIINDKLHIFFFRAYIQHMPQEWVAVKLYFNYNQYYAIFSGDTNIVCLRFNPLLKFNIKYFHVEFAKTNGTVYVYLPNVMHWANKKLAHILPLI